MDKITFHFPQSAGFRNVAYFSANKSVSGDELVCVPSTITLVIHNRHVPEILMIKVSSSNISFFPSRQPRKVNMWRLT